MTALRRYPAIQLAVPARDLAWRPSIRTHGLQSLPVDYRLRLCYGDESATPLLVAPPRLVHVVPGVPV